MMLRHAFREFVRTVFLEGAFEKREDGRYSFGGNVMIAYVVTSAQKAYIQTKFLVPRSRAIGLAIGLSSVTLLVFGWIAAALLFLSLIAAIAFWTVIWAKVHLKGIPRDHRVGGRSAGGVWIDHGGGDGDGGGD
ncbi:MAG: hypothetical protein AB7F08_15725 [Dongiaceae bacterium]